MKCPYCGAAELTHATRDLPYIHKSETTTIPAVTGDFCNACGEVILNREHGDRYSKLTGLFQQMNALTIETLTKSEQGKDVHQAKDAKDLFRQLGI